MSNKINYDLVTPLTSADGASITALTFREPTVADMQKVERVKGDAASAIAMLGACSGVNAADLQALTLRDLTGATEALQNAGFLPGGDDD